jgi:tRNA(adenine34) deaminase
MILLGKVLMTFFNDEYWMEQALSLAKNAAQKNEVPVGAIVVSENKIIGQGFNQPITLQDPTAHAEILALRNAAITIGNYRLSGASLYVTLEPCAMCAGAIVHSRIARLIYGATEPKAGAIVSQTQQLDGKHLNHKVNYVGGICADACAKIVSDFFSRRRDEKKQAPS